MVYRGRYSYRQPVRVITLFPNIFLVLFLYVERFCKSFWKVSLWRVQVAHLHNAARALSSPSRCFQLSTPVKIPFVIFDIVIKKANGMWFNVALVKFHWYGINWHVFNQYECRNCFLYFIIQKSRHKPNLENTSKYGFSPDLGGGGGEWRRSEHAHASYPGLFFRPSGFSPYMGREERRVQGLD